MDVTQHVGPQGPCLVEIARLRCGRAIEPLQPWSRLFSRFVEIETRLESVVPYETDASLFVVPDTMSTCTPTLRISK